jgi:uncharacterized protein
VPVAAEDRQSRFRIDYPERAVRALLDVNVLIALLDTDHVLHQTALSWFIAHAKAGWASCPITQNGCVRIMSNPSYPNPLPVQALVERLAEACSQPVHEFWADELSLLDASAFDATRVHGPRQITDIYLLGLAIRHDGVLVTFDDGIPLSAVRKAAAKNLLVL